MLLNMHFLLLIFAQVVLPVLMISEVALCKTNGKHIQALAVLLMFVSNNVKIVS